MLDYQMRNRRLNLQNRRMQLLSNIVQNYQDDIRFALRLIEYDLELTQMQMNLEQQQQPQQHNSTRASINTALPTPRDSRSSRPERTSAFSNTLNSGLNNTNDLFSDVSPRQTYIYTQFYYPFSQSENGITNEQLESSTQLINYDVSMNETRCPISLDAFELGQPVLRINVCGHVFSENALREWCNRHSSCPLCRKSLIEEGENENDQPPTTSVESEPVPTTPTQSQTNNTSNSNSNIINQLLSSVFTEFTGTNRSSSEFDVNDLLTTYNQLLSSTPRTNVTRRPSPT